MRLSSLLTASAAITGALALATTASAAGNLIVNGDFESAPAPANGTFTQLFGGNTFTGWTVTGNDILLIDKNYVEGGTLFFNANSPNVAVDLTGAGNTSPLDGIFQSVATQVGKIYRLSFYVGNAAPIGGNGGVYVLPSTVNLSINNGAIQGFTNSSTAGTSSGGNGINFQQFTTTFTATGASTLIAFSNGTPVGDNYAGLDDVSLIAVPEPATWAMMIMGFFGLGTILRRRHAVA